MPTRLCLQPQCPNQATYRGRCATHNRARDRETHPNKSFYNSKRWKATRKRVLYSQPLCPCGEIATDVDHIVPIEQGGNKWAASNLQALCHRCHGQKTNAEMSTR
jgi:5-methylcytosine-specific restriction enzyme A